MNLNRQIWKLKQINMCNTMHQWLHTCITGSQITELTECFQAETVTPCMKQLTTFLSVGILCYRITCWWIFNIVCIRKVLLIFLTTRTYESSSNSYYLVDCRFCVYEYAIKYTHMYSSLLRYLTCFIIDTFICWLIHIMIIVAIMSSNYEPRGGQLTPTPYGSHCWLHGKLLPLSGLVGWKGRDVYIYAWPHLCLLLTVRHYIFTY